MNTDSRLNAIVESHPYPLIFATVSGAHLYGFPSPDSDVDLRGMHVLPAEDVVGLTNPPYTIERSGLTGDLDLDLVTHDILKFSRLLLRPNGYVLEQLCSPLVVHTTPVHQELLGLVPQIVTSRHRYHYLGFARSQWRLFEKEHPRRLKPLLYVFRVLLTGLHLLRTGVIEANLEVLNDEAGLPYLPDLIAQKRTDREHTHIEDTDLPFYQAEYERLLAQLDSAESPLPEAPTAFAAINALIVHERLTPTLHR